MIEQPQSILDVLAESRFEVILGELRRRYGEAEMERIDKLIMAGEPETPSPQLLEGP